MTDEQLILSRLADVFDAFPTVAPDHVLTNTMATVGSTRQRRAWGVRLGSWRAVRLPRLLQIGVTMAGIAVLAVALGFVVSRRGDIGPARSVPAPTVQVTPTPAPSTTSLPNASLAAPTGTRTSTPASFRVPFEFTLPPSVVAVDGASSSDAFELLHVTPDGPRPVSPGSRLYALPYSGMIFALAGNMKVDVCNGSDTNQIELERGNELLDTLQAPESGWDIETTPINIGGRAGVMVWDIRQLECLKELQLSDRTIVPGRTSTRTYLVDVGHDETLVIHTWSSKLAVRGQEGAVEQWQEWLPIAEEILQSIHFQNVESSPAAI